MSDVFFKTPLLPSEGLPAMSFNHPVFRIASLSESTPPIPARCFGQEGNFDVKKQLNLVYFTVSILS
jgi:hypothetical protein